MADKVINTLKCDSLTKYGFKSGEEFINWSKGISDSEKGQVVPGTECQLELYIADSGKKYVNHVLKVETRSTPKSNGRTTTVVASKETSKDVPMTREDWDAKDRRISRQGVIQVAVQVCPVFEAAAELADKMLEYVNQKV